MSLGRGLAIPGMFAAGCTLLACDAIFGIQTFADNAASDAGGDATMDAADGGGADQVGIDTMVDSISVDSSPDSDATTDVTVADSAVDASDATGDEDSSNRMCPPLCNLGDARCAPGGLETCVTVAGCKVWSAASCPTGQTCWGVAYSAYCCGGGPSVCAPSCHVNTAGDPDAGNGQNNCGRMANESCCTTLDVTGGTFLRSYDAVTATDGTNPATVSSFGLDKYEVTVGRFRQFVAAVSAGLGWVPSDGDGVHSHLNGGNGLVDSSGAAGTYEHGWYSGFDSYLPSTTAWTAYLESDPVHSTWTNGPGAHEAFAINSVNWYVAYAFCIWDGGFLPSETEWNYAASGGADQRVYAWSVPPSSMSIGCANADYQACADAPALVGIYTSGFGKYGHADLTGGEWEWTLDYYESYVNPCFDCAYLSDPGTSLRALRGASWDYPANQLYVATRQSDDPTIHFSNDGFRCARPP